MYDRVGHTCAPGGFVELVLAGSERELLHWLVPLNVPVRFVGGRPGIREARIASARGQIVIA